MSNSNNRDEEAHHGNKGENIPVSERFRQSIEVITDNK
jgi:hypothetical protein